ncbi:DEAD/DEAH box helicase [Cyclobacterium marinum]|uniref:DEAD/DEAH box helicase domain protein n=1 Tax=Cyclobacterium marinum (strain ATCC 25205 / DSM 745 / LMG 13164 / NCIMB 1802) TaxID=880070 RepID=G0IVN9_CYCMS|nr:DEAD/DEAH box helicase [Cyclobacterium marinum]AEL24806.1 DEAD/DEAH box helicase domain protein [Cyclobacterium marinum DSM 745]MBR9774719.1 DEAD/DEAH box helicase [Cytophagales bacterium]|tara:strand:- start:25768 stop:27123 length:1356 start_codon:yes stop_codon:yes gene_type:complete
MSDQLSSFENFKLNNQLLNAVKEIGYEKPTPIQEKAIPLALAGHDILGIAQTGTGKTAAYVLPLLYKVKYAQGQHPRALIMAPTRELVMQIEEAVVGFGKYTDLRYVCLYGGLGPKPQIEKLQEGVDIIIATPGRFIDLYHKGEIYTRDIKTMVLDEADKMLDMGFLPQIKNILEVIPVKRQNLLFSATFSQRVENLSYEFLEFPERVEVAPQATTAETIAQVKYFVPNIRTKLDLLLRLVNEDGFERGIIFTKSRKNADTVHQYLQKNQSGSIRVIHANKGQNTRINSMDDFKKGEVKILVATDVAARGLDVSLVSHVINFDVPLIYEDYVHRIGRTGRAENEGKAATFINPAEAFHFEKIESIIRKLVPEQEIPEEITQHKTPFEEKQAYEREIDKQKRGDDPEFKGAFHEKKGYSKPYKEKEEKRGNKNSKAKRNRNQMKKKSKHKNK